MSLVGAEGPRFNAIFRWGSVVVAILGLFLMATGSFERGLLFVAAAGIIWLFAKRRGRKA